MPDQQHTFEGLQRIMDSHSKALSEYFGRGESAERTRIVAALRKRNVGESGAFDDYSRGMADECQIIADMLEAGTL